MATILLRERQPGASLRYTPASYAGRVLVGHQPVSFANTTDTIDDLNFGRLRAASCLDEPLVDSNIWVPSRFIRSMPSRSDWYLVRDDDLGPLEWSPATWDDTLAFVRYVRDASRAADALQSTRELLRHGPQEHLIVHMRQVSDAGTERPIKPLEGPDSFPIDWRRRTIRFRK